jgi:hypothetical protein
VTAQPPARDEDAFHLANSTVDPSGLDILDPDGNRVAWGRGEYAGVALRAINGYIGGDADARHGLRLGVVQEQRLRQWPKDRIRPKSVALGVMSLLAEVDALRAEARQAEQCTDRAEAALAQWKDYADRVSDLLVKLTPTIGHIVTSPYLRAFDALAGSQPAAREGGE